MYKLIAIVALAVSVSACGKWDRAVASYTGAAETCYKGVKYIQFTSGASVMYKPDGTIATCNS